MHSGTLHSLFWWPSRLAGCGSGSSGREMEHKTSRVLARVLRGEQPRNMPFEEVHVKKLVLNHDVAKVLGITFPPDMAKAASQ